MIDDVLIKIMRNYKHARAQISIKNPNASIKLGNNCILQTLRERDV